MTDEIGLAQAATGSVIDWSDEDDDGGPDNDSSSNKAPLILITDHPVMNEESFSQAHDLKWLVHHRRGSVEAKLENGWSSSPPEKYGRLFYSTEESRGNGFMLVDFEVPTRSKPFSHPGVDSPLCCKCKELELSFFDPSCLGCSEILLNPKTSISHIFAIMRQWVPQIQQNIDVFIKEILRRGGHVNDRDALTDMTMLHYACKSGAGGVGDPVVASETVQALIDKGADFAQKCRWTDMLPLHYATFFDIVPVINILLNASGGSDADSPCKEFDNGTPLHIACSNLCLKAAKCLLHHKANPNFQNGIGQKPRECLPQASSVDQNSDMFSVLLKMQALLLDAENSSKSFSKESLNDATLRALGLAIGDNVIVSGKRGVLLYCGPTDFASGHWAGIALNEPTGKNDGSVGGVKYFQCEPNYGIFAPVSRVTKASQNETISESSTDGPYSVKQADKLARYLSKFPIGERVLVAGQKEGQVRFVGETKFATGIWIGVELDEPSGKNDGSVADVRYFKCLMNYGIFAPVSKVEKLMFDADETNRSRGIQKKGAVNGTAVRTESPDSDDNSSKSNTKSSSSDAENRMTGTEKHGFNQKLSRQVSGSPTQQNGIPRKEKEHGVHAKKDRSEELPRTSIDPSFKLKTGMSVYVNNELGIIRYIGQVEFADGVWLGVELRKPSGKNDGAVGDKRYFTCLQAAEEFSPRGWKLFQVTGSFELHGTKVGSCFKKFKDATQWKQECIYIEDLAPFSI